MTAFEGRGRSVVTDPSELLSVDRYREFVFRALPRPSPIQMRIGDALGLTLAEDVYAEEALPAFANSAMDGYAVRAQDVAAATQDDPVEVEVVGEAAAGANAATLHVGEGQAVRIMTGAPLPSGADAVVPVELTSGSGSRVSIHVAHDAGANIRPVGDDVTRGRLLAKAGTRLGPGHIGLLTAVGSAVVQCFPTPRVVVISTGDELVGGQRDLGPGQIRDSNGPMLAAMVRQAGGAAYAVGPIRDDRGALVSAIEENLGHADMVLLSGGVSAGAHDHVEDVVRQLGDVAKFKVAMKPGMPQVVGRIRGVPVLGLPGNPVSAFVSFEVFVRPALRVLQGRRDLLRPLVTAALTEEVRSPEHKRTYLRVRLARDDGRWVATPTGSQGSHAITSIADADGLAEIPEDLTSMAAGELVRVHLLVEV
jgi:molybdopterin molybdotransferase